MRRTTIPALIVLAAIRVPAFAAGYTYQGTNASVTGLGTLPTDSSAIAEDINNHGDIVGTSHAVADSRPFAYWGNQMFAIDTGPDYVEGAGASAINDSREVVGWWFFLGFAPPFNGGFHWHPGMPAMEKLQSDTAPGFGYSWDVFAADINNSGVIAGSAERIPNSVAPPNTVDLCFHNLPVRWPSPLSSSFPNRLFCIADPNQNESWLEQGLRPVAFGINDAGSIVGTDGGSTTFSMFLFKNGLRIPVPAPAGVPQVDNNGYELDGYARAVSDNDVVAGTYGYKHNGGAGGPGSYRRAFYWNGVSATSVNLGVFSGGTWSEAYDVNAQRMVVGTSDKVYAGGAKRDTAFIWHPDFGLYALPGFAPAGSLTPGHCRAKAMNNRKSSNLVQVVGYCVVNGQQHAVRWDVTVIQFWYLNP